VVFFYPVHTGFSLAIPFSAASSLADTSSSLPASKSCLPPRSSTNFPLSPFFGIQPWNQRSIRYQTSTIIRLSLPQLHVPLPVMSKTNGKKKKKGKTS